MILMGAGTNHWFHSDATYRAFLDADRCSPAARASTAAAGRTTSARRSAARSPAGSTLAFALDWRRPPRQMTGTSFWYLHTEQWRYDGFGADAAGLPARPTGSSTGMTHRRRASPRRRGVGWMPSYPQFDRNPLDLADEARGRAAGEAPSGVVDRAERSTAACGSPSRTPTHPDNWPRVLIRVAGQPARLLRQGQRVLPAGTCSGTDDVLRPGRRRPEAPAPAATSPGATRPPRASSTCCSSRRLPDDHRPRCFSRRRAAGGDLVREARPRHHRHAPVRPRVQPGDRRRRGRPAPTSTPSTPSRRASPTLADDRTSAPARTWSRCRCCTTPPTRWPTRTARSGTGGTGSATPVPGVTMPGWSWWSATTARSREKMAALGPLLETARHHRQERHRTGVEGRSRLPRAHERHGPGRRRPTAGRRLRDATAPGRGDPGACPAPPTGTWPPRGSRTLEERVGDACCTTWPASARASGSRFADTQCRPVPVITSPEWSGTETGGRRYSPFTINVERLKPWHTLTGRHALLPRPRLDDRGRRGAAGLPAAPEHAARCSASRHRPRRRARRSRCAT